MPISCGSSTSALLLHSATTGTADSKNQQRTCSISSDFADKLETRGVDPRRSSKIHRANELRLDRKALLDILQQCGQRKDIVVGRRVHGHILRKEQESGLLKDIYVATALLHMYARCGAMQEAQMVFDELRVRDVVAWTALIIGYVRHGSGDEALKCFRKMRFEGILPDAISFVCILKACGSIGCSEIGEEIHCEVEKQGLLGRDVMLGNALVDMFCKCGMLGKAKRVFEALPVRNVVSWTSMIAGYAQNELAWEAIEYFNQMQDDGILPNSVTFVCVLKACATVGYLQMGEEIHSFVQEKRLLQKDVVLGNALMLMYAKCGSFDKAREVLDAIKAIRNISSWNTLISGYVQIALDDEAVACFYQMRDEGVYPNTVTFICILKACGNVGYLNLGEGVYAEAKKQGLLRKDAVLCTSLIDMYNKCGMLGKAQQVFEEIPLRDIVSCNALMAGYANRGNASGVFHIFDQTLRESIMPDAVTFVAVLTACTHAGLVEEGQRVFDEMCFGYMLTPSSEHYTCMVDLFGRSGHFDKAKRMLERVQHFNHAPLFLALLNACCKWPNVELGKWAFKQLVQLEQSCDAAYVCMASIYAAADI